MDERRVDLGLKWRELSARAGISYEALRAIRIGQHEPSALNKRRIEDAFRWARGSLDTIAEGGDPTPLDDAVAADSELAGKTDEELLQELLRRRLTREHQAAGRGALSIDEAMDLGRANRRPGSEHDGSVEKGH